VKPLTHQTDIAASEDQTVAECKLLQTSQQQKKILPFYIRDIAQKIIQYTVNTIFFNTTPLLSSKLQVTAKKTSSAGS